MEKNFFIIEKMFKKVIYLLETSLCWSLHDGLYSILHRDDEYALTLILISGFTYRISFHLTSLFRHKYISKILRTNTDSTSRINTGFTNFI